MDIPECKNQKKNGKKTNSRKTIANQERKIQEKRSKDSPVCALDSLGLVQHHVFPLDLAKNRLVCHNGLVRRHEHVKWRVLGVQQMRIDDFAENFALFDRAPIRQNLEFSKIHRNNKNSHK
jgi:hypothetical protein